MIKIATFIIAAALCALISVPRSAHACWCIIECNHEINDIERLEKKIAKLESKIDPLEDRLAQAIETRDSELEKYDAQLAALLCTLDQTKTDGEELLENFLSDPANAECGETCTRYMRLKALVERQICRAQKAYDRFAKKRDSLEARLQGKVDRLTRDLAKLNADLAELQDELLEAQDAYRVCRLHQDNIGCACYY